MPVIVNGTQLKCSNSPSGPGHHWVVYTATVTGRLQVDPGSYRNVRWVSGAELETLAARTLAYATGRLPGSVWQTTPGIEPVWLHWLTKAGLLHLAGTDLDAVEAFLRGGGR